MGGASPQRRGRQIQRAHRCCHRRRRVNDQWQSIPEHLPDVGDKIEAPPPGVAIAHRCSCGASSRRTGKHGRHRAFHQLDVTVRNVPESRAERRSRGAATALHRMSNAPPSSRPCAWCRPRAARLNTSFISAELDKTSWEEAMAESITRVELQGANPSDYTRLNELMLEAHFYRTITGVSGAEYELPSATYWSKSESFTVMQIRDLAREQAKKTNKPNWVITTRGTSSWYLNKV